MTTNSSLPHELTAPHDGVTFEDVAAEVGIAYSRAESPEREAVFDELRQLPTYTLDDINRTPLFSRGTPGVATLDYDNDGDLDIYVTNGPGTANSLYSNQLEETGQLNFVDVAEASGVALTEQDSTGVSFGDIDNDGDQDLLVLGAGSPNRLLENQGDGTFIDITETSGIGGDHRYSSSASMGDINGDGLLDIVIANSFDWNTFSSLTSESQIFDGKEHNQLLLNQGNNQFIDVSATSGIENLTGLSEIAPPGVASVTWAVAMVDYDLDGDVDIIHADDQGPIPSEDESPDGVDRGLLHVFENDGTGNFTDVNVEVNLDIAGGWMGLSFGDFNADGNLDIFGSNIGDYATTLSPEPLPVGQRASRWFLGQDDGTFSDPGAGDLVATVFGWGTSTLDYDNDGDTDIVYYGGLDFPPAIDASNPGALLRNDGNANFSYDAEALATAANHGRRSDKGVAVGDLDQDGFLDIVSASNFDFPEPTPRLPFPVTFGSPFDEVAGFVPTFTPTDNPGEFVWSGLETPDGTLAVEINSGDNGNGSVQVELMGTVDLISDGSVNRDGIGSMVFFTPENGQTVMQPILGGSSFLSQDSLAANFGLGSAQSGTVEILWPGGVRNRLYDVEEFDRIVFPEIPVSFDGEFESQQDYEAQVSEAISELVEKKVLTEADAEKFFDSAVRAFVENQQVEEIPEQSESSETAEIELVRDMLTALENGDRETFLELQTANVNWEFIGNTAAISPNTITDTQIVPFAGSWFGREGISRSVGEFFDITQESLEISKIEPLDLLQEDNQIVARVNVEATVKETGLPFDFDMAYIVEVEEIGEQRGQIESVRVVNNSFFIAEAFAGQSPSPEAIELNDINPLEGIPLSVNPDADSEETLQVVESAYQELAQRDLEGFAQFFAEDAPFIFDGDPNVITLARLVEGPEGVVQFFANAFQFFETRIFNIENIVADGDRAVAVLQIQNAVNENGFPVNFDALHFVTVEDGLISDLQIIVDTYDAASALAGEPLFLQEQLPDSNDDNNLVFGTPEVDEFDGVDPTDNFDGEGDTIFTGAKDDLVDASQATIGQNHIFAGTGLDEVLVGRRDRVSGGVGDDILDASVGSGGNRLYGGDGDDELFAGSGDRLFGSEGDDILNASVGSGNNRLYGEGGNDTFFAGSGDRLLGGDGDDSFFMTDGGDNVITGGDGADAFWIATGEILTAANTITDFNIGEDVIGVAGLGAASINDLDFSQVGDDAMISFSGFDLTMLLNTDVSDLQTNGNFVFA